MGAGIVGLAFGLNVCMFYEVLNCSVAGQECMHYDLSLHFFVCNHIIEGYFLV